MDGMFLLGLYVGGTVIGTIVVAVMFLWSVRNLYRLLGDKLTALVRAGLVVTAISAIIMPIAVILVFFVMFNVPSESPVDFVGYALLVVLLLSLVASLGLQPSRKPVREVEDD